MKVRIVAAALMVALAFGSSAFAQDRDEEILEFSVPGPELDRSLESDLPLQGVLSDSPIPTAEVRETASRARQAGPFDQWLSSVRGRVSRIPLRRLALAAGAACGLVMIAWAVLAFLRKKSRRTYRRLPRSAGGSPTRSLEEVVAAVQLGQSRSRGHVPLEDPITGREWPR